MMGKKVGGKMTIGQYISFQKKYYMWLVIAALGAAILGSFMGWGQTLIWLVEIYGAFVYFWFGYQLVKMHRGEMKDALIGGAVLGVIPSVLFGISQFIYWTFIFSQVSFLGISYGPSGIGQLIYYIVIGVVGSLVMSIIGFAVAGGFSKPGASTAPRA